MKDEPCGNRGCPDYNKESPGNCSWRSGSYINCVDYKEPMKEITTLAQARDWFLNNSGGGVICISHEREIECYSYPEAEEFFQTEDELEKNR